MKRRPYKYLLTAALLCAALTLPAKAVRRSAAVQVDGSLVTHDAYVEQGVTYVPLRALLNTLGGWRVWWDGDAGQAAAVSDDAVLRADPGENAVAVNGQQFSGRVTVERGVTYVPLRLVCEALGCGVEWDPYLDGAAVTSPGASYDAGELYWLSRIIYAESGAESMAGQIAVGNVILNRVRSSRFPDTVEGVIFDRKDAVQFEPVGNGRIYQTPSPQSVEAARRALDGERIVGAALYFYAPALSQGVWINANCAYQQTIGCHRFYV